MSLHEYKMPSLKDKIREQGEQELKEKEKVEKPLKTKKKQKK